MSLISEPQYRHSFQGGICDLIIWSLGWEEQFYFSIDSGHSSATGLYGVTFCGWISCWPWKVGLTSLLVKVGECLGSADFGVSANVKALPSLLESVNCVIYNIFSFWFLTWFCQIKAWLCDGWRLYQEWLFIEKYLLVFIYLNILESTTSGLISTWCNL